MSAAICSNCKAEFEKSLDDKSIICPACDAKIKLDVKVFEISRIVFYVFGLIAPGLFIPFLLIPLFSGANASGMYRMGKKSAAFVSVFGLLVLNFLTLLATIGCFTLAAHFKVKLEEKEAEYFKFTGKRLPIQKSIWQPKQK